MVSRRLLLALTLVCLFVGGIGAALYLQQRIERCAAVPLWAENLLPNADLALSSSDSPLPSGWRARTPGAALGAFAVDGDGRALQLIGIANALETPAVAVHPSTRYCATALAITDSDHGSTTRLRTTFDWYDANATLVTSNSGLWQPVVLWQAAAPPASWSPMTASFVAPADATTLRVRFQPASDDRVYLDAFALRVGGQATSLPPLATVPISITADPQSPLPTLNPWPNALHAALSLSFDWETAMGGLIHSRSVGDPFFDQDPATRAMRMREGVTTTLRLFQPYGIRATYFATGYNFLLGNVNHSRFMGDPTYAWANRTNRWVSDRWTTTPWFSADPYGTYQTHPAWYFGDLIPVLRNAGQAIESHTFSHFYGGFVTAPDWVADLATWNTVAQAQGVAAPHALAFPWSSSGGMSDASWAALEAAGVYVVTRLSDQSPYNLFPTDEFQLPRDPRCRPLPGHPGLLGCPDFYLTPASAARAVTLIDRIVATGGMIDLWAHTEEVTSAAQQAAWTTIVTYAAKQPNLWIAPLAEIATWQQALMQVQLERSDGGNAAPTWTLFNPSGRDLVGLTLHLPFVPRQIALNGDRMSTQSGSLDPLTITLRAGERLEVTAWPLQ